METWTWMNKILLCKNHMLVYMDMVWNSCWTRKNWNTSTKIFIKEYVRTVVKGDFCALVNGTYCCHGWEDIYGIWEAAAMTENVHVYLGAVERFIFSQGMTYHQCREWHIFIWRKVKSPPLTIGTMLPAQQADILATIIWRNQFNYLFKISVKYKFPYFTIQFPCNIAKEL